MTRRILFFAFCFIILSSVRAQENIPAANPGDQHTYSARQPKPVDVRHVYIGMGNGAGYIGLMGLTAEFSLYKNLSLVGSAGYSTWGFLLRPGLRYYQKFPTGIYYNACFNRSTGRKEVKLLLETASGTEDTILVRLKPVNDIDLGVGYMWRLWKKGRLNVEIGYSFDVSFGEFYKLKALQPELSENGKESMDNSKPGGFYVGLGLSIGL
jgi:hypothetical protein